MKVKQLYFALLFSALGLSTLQAQNAETLRLSLSESQQYAVQHNYSLQNASLDVQKAEAAKWQTLSSMLPQVSSSFDYSNMLGYEMSMGGFRIPLNPYGTFAVTASIALSALTLQEATRKSVQAGAVESIELDKLSVQVATLRNSITSNRRALKMLYSSLILQLGADGNTQLVLTTPLEQVMNVDEAARLTMGGFNMQDNNNYQLLEENEKLSQMQVTNAWLQFTPTVTAFYQYNAKTYFGKEEGMNMTPPQMVGASINLPIFQSGSRLAAIRQAKISQQENANTKQQTEDALQVQFNQDCYNLISAIESYQIQKENLSVTKRVLDNISNKYRIGYASNLEVTNASTDFITAQSNYVQAVMEVVTAQIALENLLGKDK